MKLFEIEKPIYYKFKLIHRRLTVTMIQFFCLNSVSIHPKTNSMLVKFKTFMCEVMRRLKCKKPKLNAKIQQNPAESAFSNLILHPKAKPSKFQIVLKKKTNFEFSTSDFQYFPLKNAEKL